MTAEEFLPQRRTMATLRGAAEDCRGCDLYRNATQTVFGRGPGDARVIMVGEQPGDREDLAGRPFVGPAGRMLDRGLEDAGIDRDLVYVTNVVKHFRFTRKGKRRIHRRPSAEQIHACRPWLDAELELVDPDVLVPMGATAAQALLGRRFRLSKDRGRPMPWDGGPVAVATIHPSAILRAPDDESRHQEFRRFVADLRAVRKAMEERSRAAS